MLDAIPIQLNPSTIGRVDDGEGGEVGNVLDSGRGVGNGVDRDRVNIVVDGDDKLPAHVPTSDTNNDKKSTKPTTRTLQQLQREPTTATPMVLTIKKWPIKNTAMPGCLSFHH